MSLGSVVKMSTISTISNCLCLCVTKSSILRDSFPVRYACLPTYINASLLSMRHAQSDKISDSGNELHFCLSLAPSRLQLFTPPTNLLFKELSLRLETTSEMHQQKCTERLTRRSTHLLVWCQS